MTSAPIRTDSPVPSRHRPHAPRWMPRGDRLGLDLIALFKFVKAATLIAAGLAAFGLLSPSLADQAHRWLERLALGHGHRLGAAIAATALRGLGAASGKRLVELGVGAFLYACVVLVEGIGLWRCKRWAEYLTVLVTISFMPFEIVALAHRFTPIRALTLALNIAVVIYLIWQLWRHRHDHGATRLEGRTAPY